MLNYVWSIPDGKKYIFIKSFVSLLNSALPLMLAVVPGLIINELTGEKGIPVLTAYIGITAAVPFVQKVIISSINVYLNRLRYYFMIEVKISALGFRVKELMDTMSSAWRQLLIKADCASW